MTKVSSDTISNLIGPQYVGGMSAGFEAVKWDVKGDLDINSATPTVDVHLDEKSLEKSEKKEGVSHKPDPNSKVSTREAQSDKRYDSMFQKHGLPSSMPWRFGAKHDYKQLSMAKGPVSRINQRRMLELRRTFNQIAAVKKKTVAVNPEALPLEDIKRMLQEALANGKTTTPLGSIERTMKFAGFDPHALRKAYNRWEHALIPGSYESGPSMKGDT